LNDPFDCNIQYIVENEKVRQDPSLNKVFSDKTYYSSKNFGIYCVTKSPDNLHFWSLYGDSHQGICLEFNENKFSGYYSNLFNSDCELKNCIYRDSPIDVLNWIPSDEQDRTKAITVEEYLYDPKILDKLFRDLYLQKNKKVWHNEDEKRIILAGLALNNINSSHHLEILENGYLMDAPKDSLTSIILGAKITPINEKQILKINKEFYDNKLVIKKIVLDGENWMLKIINH
jgi:Protein of unknown function (DUF2971).